MTTKEIANNIKKVQFTNKPVIIALDGFGGAGKSTLAKELKEALGSACVVEVDDFFMIGVESDADKSNFDRERLRQQVLIPLRSGRPAAYQRVLWPNDELSDFINVPDVDYIILEGVSSFHPDIAEYVDYKIWLDISGEEAKQRMIHRDRAQGEEHGELWDHWTDSYQMYKDLHQPEKQADLVVKYRR